MLLWCFEHVTSLKDLMVVLITNLWLISNCLLFWTCELFQNSDNFESKVKQAKIHYTVTENQNAKKHLLFYDEETVTLLKGNHKTKVIACWGILALLILILLLFGNAQYNWMETQLLADRQWYQSVSSGMIISVTSPSFLLTKTKTEVLCLTASLTSWVVWTGCPLMPMMTSWSVIPPLQRYQHHTINHKLKRCQTLRKTPVTFTQDKPAPVSAPPPKKPPSLIVNLFTGRYLHVRYVHLLIVLLLAGWQ